MTRYIAAPCKRRDTCILGRRIRVVQYGKVRTDIAQLEEIHKYERSQIRDSRKQISLVLRSMTEQYLMLQGRKNPAGTFCVAATKLADIFQHVDLLYA